MITLGLASQTLVALCLYWGLDDPGARRVEWERMLLDHRGQGFVFGYLGMMALGWWDDLRGMAAMKKLTFQALIVSLALGWSGLSMTFLVDVPPLNFAVTLLWVLFISNAFNLMDNTDGHCASVALVAYLAHAALMAAMGHYLIAGAALAFAGPLLAFLRFNWPPARIYLGDAGSLSLGFGAGMLAVYSTYYHEGQSVAALAAPIMILVVPIFDVLTVFWLRWRLSLPLMVGDRRHVAHRLQNQGWSQPKILAALLALATLGALGGFLVSLGNNGIALMALVLFSLGMLAAYRYTLPGCQAP